MRGEERDYYQKEWVIDACDVTRVDFFDSIAGVRKRRMTKPDSALDEAVICASKHHLCRWKSMRSV